MIIVHISELNGFVHTFCRGYEIGFILEVLEDIKLMLVKRYNIFLSFKGKDTRTNLTYHLYHALKSEGFKIFMDDEEIETGSSISEVIVEAIENSRLSIIIFLKILQTPLSV